MERTLIIKFWFDLTECPVLEYEQEEMLENNAKSTIFEMMQEGHTSGELNDVLNFGCLVDDEIDVTGGWKLYSTINEGKERDEPLIPQELADFHKKLVVIKLHTVKCPNCGFEHTTGNDDHFIPVPLLVGTYPTAKSTFGMRVEAELQINQGIVPENIFLYKNFRNEDILELQIDDKPREKHKKKHYDHKIKRKLK